MAAMRRLLRRALSGVRIRQRLLLFAPILLAGGAAAYWCHGWPVRHFAVVEKGVLYRSAQPDQAGWERLRDHYHIRTVIDLREGRPDEPWAVLERDFCLRNGIAYVKRPIRHAQLTGDELRAVVAVIADPRRQPVLIHCELGRSRTGVVVAAYRMIEQGWPLEAALRESQRFKDHMEPPYVARLQELARGRWADGDIARWHGGGQRVSLRWHRLSEPVPAQPGKAVPPCGVWHARADRGR